MAVHERSLGPAYLARVPLGVDWCPPHTGGIVQMHAPWRRGRAVIIPIWKGQALATLAVQGHGQEPVGLGAVPVHPV